MIILYQMMLKNILRRSVRLYKKGLHPKESIRVTKIFKIVRLVLSFALSFLLTFSGAYTILIYSSLGKLEENLITDRPPADPMAGNSVNIMIMGLDNRDNNNGDFAINDVPGSYNTDTNIIIHISSDRKRAEFVSIPRDSMVDIPSCNTKKGVVQARGLQMFNSAFPVAMLNDGSIDSGAACAVKTVEQNTGLHIDGYAVVSFDGFKQMIDALGGVDMCIQDDIYSPDAGNLSLKKGCQHLDGYTATEYARARTGEGLGDGSDLSRINRQQDLMIQIFKTVLKQNIITDLPNLLKFASSAVKDMKTTYDVTELVGLAASLTQLKLSNVYFVTVPNAAYIPDPNRVAWTEEANTLWSELKKNKKLTVSGVKRETEKTTSKKTTSKKTETTTK